MAIQRYNSAGTVLNPIVVSNEKDTVNAVKVRNGRTVYVGAYKIGSGLRTAYVARRNADNTPDTSFGFGGVVPIRCNEGVPEKAVDLSITAGGDIIVLIASGVASPLSTCIVRAQASNGLLDTTFGNSGFAVASLSSTVTPLEIAVDPDLIAGGDIVVLGDGQAGEVARLSSDGKTRRWLASGLTFFHPFVTSQADAAALAVDQQGRTIVAGSSLSTLGVLRLTRASGSLDNSFDSDGRVQVPFGTGGVESATSVVMSGNDIVVVGHSTASAFDREALLARFTAAGVLSTSTIFSFPFMMTGAPLEATVAGNDLYVSCTAKKEASPLGFQLAKMNVNSFELVTVFNGGFASYFDPGEHDIANPSVAVDTASNQVVLGGFATILP